jgi:hypothetical protein
MQQGIESLRHVEESQLGAVAHRLQRPNLGRTTIVCAC